MIKRLAHRNANVQLYTLEVSGDDESIADDGRLTHCPVGKCSIAKLRSKHAQRASLKEFYGCYAAACE